MDVLNDQIRNELEPIIEVKIELLTSAVSHGRVIAVPLVILKRTEDCLRRSYRGFWVPADRINQGQGKDWKTIISVECTAVGGY